MWQPPENLALQGYLGEGPSLTRISQSPRRKVSRGATSFARNANAGAPRTVALALAGLVAIVLCLPRLGLGYFWDDYIFLTSNGVNPLAFLLPNETTIFYRPISMGLYFLLLGAVDPTEGWVAHFLNLGLLVSCVLALATLVTRIAGFRAGLIAGISYAALGATASLVAWVTVSHDLLAIAFLLLAFHLRHSGRTIGALAAAGCAIFSKETALAVLPALVLWPWLVNRKPYRLALHGLLYLGLAAVWGAVHRGVQAFLAHGFSSVTTGYVHAQSPESWPLKAGRYLLHLFNVPWTGHATRWPSDLMLCGIVGVGLLAVSLWLGLRSADRGATATTTISTRRAIVLAALLVLPPLALDVVLVGHWAPYYLALPGLGAALLLGVLLSRSSIPIVTFVLSGYLILGLWCRGVADPETLAFTEENFLAGSRATRDVERNFKGLHESFPPGSHLLVSVGQTGTLGIAQTLHQGQAPRLWYRDPSLETLLPQERRDSARPQFLFRVMSDLHVLEIDPDSLRVRSSGGTQPHPDEIGRTIRSYARGLAATGESDRAVRILERLGQVDGGLLYDYDLRLAAMIRYAQGRFVEAETLKARSSLIPREFAIDMVGKVLAEPTADSAMDSCAFWAFDASPTDTSVVARLMRLFRDGGYRDQACVFARRMRELAPEDTESVEILRRCASRG